MSTENEPTTEAVETLGTLEAQLIEAQGLLAIAQREAYDARRRETSLLNEVNRLQKGINAYVKAMREKAPVDTDWRRSLQGKHPAEN